MAAMTGNAIREALAPEGVLPLRVNELTPSVIICAEGSRISIQWREQRPDQPDHDEYGRAEAMAAFLVEAANRHGTAYDAIGSGVKALEWERWPRDPNETVTQGSTGLTFRLRAEHAFGVVFILEKNSEFFFQKGSFGRGEGVYLNLDEAKAAAQADFERRVLSCLSTHTAAGAGPVDVGSPEWCDRAERSEWAFMAKMLREAIDYIAPVNLSGLVVAEGIAKSRSEEGWRTKAAGAGPVEPRRMAEGCCSAISPCGHQQRDPYSICDVCTRAAGAGPVSEAVAWREFVLSRIKALGEGDQYGLKSFAIAELQSILDHVARPVEPGEVERDEAPQTDGGFLTKGERAAIDKLGEATALRRELAEARGLIRDAIGLVPLAHQNWHTDARTVLGDAQEAKAQQRSYPGNRTREEWEIVAQASAARAAHLPED